MRTQYTYIMSVPLLVNIRAKRKKGRLWHNILKYKKFSLILRTFFLKRNLNLKL